MARFSTSAAALLFITAMAGLGLPAHSHERPDPAKLIQAQQQAMAKLAFMDGQWRGSAWTLLPSGEKHTLTQTERIGPMLDGAIKVVEGRGYDATGKVVFNAFATIVYNPATKAFTMNSSAMGQHRHIRYHTAA